VQEIVDGRRVPWEPGQRRAVSETGMTMSPAGQRGPDRDCSAAAGDGLRESSADDRWLTGADGDSSQRAKVAWNSAAAAVNARVCECETDNCEHGECCRASSGQRIGAPARLGCDEPMETNDGDPVPLIEKILLID